MANECLDLTKRLKNSRQNSTRRQIEGTNQLLAEVREKVGLNNEEDDNELDLSSDSARDSGENGPSRMMNIPVEDVKENQTVGAQELLD